jgi:hypothetical protein
MLIRITEVPPGEAPEDVRRAWVGLVLPLAPGERGARAAQTSGVLTGPRHVLASLLHLLLGWTRPQQGYVVDAAQAIWLLGESAPDAAAWWRDHAPHVLRPGFRFMFPTWCCREEHDGPAGRHRAPGPPDSDPGTFQAPPSVRPP